MAFCVVIGTYLFAMGIGLAGALAVNRLIASLLFGVQPTDTVTIAFVITTITAVAVAALLLQRHRRRQALDRVDVGLVKLLK